MHTGVISFCDRINYNIKSLESKDDILAEIQRLYNIHILQRHWYHMDDKGYDNMVRQPHLACLRSNGNPYYMYMTRYEDVPIVYFIDKKVHPTYQQPRILLGRGLWDESLFTNTIMDGEMVKDNNNKWVFLINDVIGYKGKFLMHETLPQRLEYAFDILDMHRIDNIVDCCTYKVKQYSMSTREGVDALIELSKQLPYTTRGIYFWPYSAKHKPKLINFDESLITSVVRKVKDVPEFREIIASPPDIEIEIDNHNNTQNHIQPKSPHLVDSPYRVDNTDTVSEADVRLFHKTDKPDVYEVYKQQSGGNRIKVGLATIPTMKVSKMMRAVFKDATVAMYIPFVCEYQKDTDKWLPLRQQ